MINFGEGVYQYDEQNDGNEFYMMVNFAEQKSKTDYLKKRNDNDDEELKPKIAKGSYAKAFIESNKREE